MNILIKPRRIRYIIYAIIIALFSTTGMQISLLNISKGRFQKKLESVSGIVRFIRTLKVSISGQNELAFLYSIIMIGIFILFLIVFTYQFSKREIIGASCLSILFGLCRWVGVVFSHKESWNYFFQNKFVIILNIWYMAGHALFLFGILLLSGKAVINYQKKNNNSLNIKSEKRYSLKKMFFQYVIIIFICWLPYYISLWPGTIHGDFSMQVLQLFHYPTILQEQVTSDGVNILYSNDHPFIHTQITGVFIKLGHLLHHLEWGYGLYTFLQMSAYIIGIAVLLVTLRKFNVNRYVVQVTLVLYALLPVFPVYSILVGGDAFFALIFLYFMIEVIWMFGTKGRIFINKRFNVAVIITAFLLAAAKNQGLYVLGIFSIICLVYFRKYWIRVLVSMFLPIMFFQFIYVGIIFPMCKVSTVGSQEKLSVCFQQTARYVKYHKNEVTEQEKSVINKVLEYEKIGKKYNPQLSDPVKSTYKNTATSKDMKNYFKVWLQMGLKHPDEYIQSFLANTYAYYSPTITTTKRMYFRLNSTRFYEKTRPWTKGIIPQHFINKNNCESPEALKPVRRGMISFCKLTYHIPIVNWLYNPGIITWIIFICFFICWLGRRYDIMIMFLPTVLIICVCLLSPKNNNLRYIYPACCIVPAIIATTLQGTLVSIRFSSKRNPELLEP